MRIESSASDNLEAKSNGKTLGSKSSAVGLFPGSATPSRPRKLTCGLIGRTADRPSVGTLSDRHSGVRLNYTALGLFFPRNFLNVPHRTGSSSSTM